MKKLVVLLSVVALGTASAMAQATIAFANQGTGQLITVSQASDGSNPTTIGGNNATSASIGAGPASVVFTLWMATNGNAVNLGANNSFAPVSGLVLVGTVTNSSSTSSLANGVFNGGNPYTVPGAFDGSFQVEYVYYAHTLNNNYAGHSTLATGYSLATGGGPTTATFGAGANQVLAFTLLPVPEPTSLALGGLGVAALLIFRRKK